jgi:hypothetical protein
LEATVLQRQQRQVPTTEQQQGSVWAMLQGLSLTRAYILPDCLTSLTKLLGLLPQAMQKQH